MNGKHPLKMPQCCVVPECSNRKSGHRFPKDKDLMKKWLVAIRRDTVMQGGKVREVWPSPHWRVCNDHFAPEDFTLPKDSVSKNPRPILKKDVVPSRFAWSGRPSNTDLKKRAADKKRQTYNVNHIGKSVLVAKKTDTNSAPPPLVYFSQPSEVLEEIEHVNVNEIKAETVDFDEETEGAEFHVEAEYHEENNSSKKDAQVQCLLCSCESVLGTRVTASPSNQTISSYFKIEHLIDKADELKFYSGFGDYDHFMFVFNLLGDQVNSHDYFPTDQTGTITSTLSPVNKFFMTLVKLRRNMSYIEMCFRFGVTSTFAGIIVITWINFLYCKFKELNVWAPSEVVGRKMEEEKTIPIVQQQTYSIFHFCNTFKVLVGISTSGSVTFVSNVFKECISDRELFEKCSLKNLLQDGDIIMCGEGSVIEDLVAHKNVTINTTQHNNLERVNSVGETYQILQDQLPTDLEQMANKIIYVCFMLANFRSNIIV